MEAGRPRDEAYRIVQEAAQRAWDEGRRSAACSGEAAPELDLDAVFDPSAFVRHAAGDRRPPRPAGLRQPRFVGHGLPVAAGLASLRMALLLGFLGVLGFSFTLPATRLAVADLDPTFVGLGRAVVAALLGVVLLRLLGGPRPTRAQLGRLLLVALGVVFGFPLLSAFALRELTAAHSAVIVGLLPAATAVMAVLRAGERPSRGFWLASGAGLVAVLAFAASQGAGLPSTADLLVLGAVAFGAVGYAEGATLARELGGWRVICWALLLSLPVTLPAAVLAAAQGGLQAGDDAWLGFAYVSLVSMFTAFFALVRGSRPRRCGQDRPDPAGSARADAGLVGGAAR